ncbi:MAG: RNA methyltransferase [Clostridia bacterium]|nr:RNA methyltransferase [Clostridia bacterium]
MIKEITSSKNKTVCELKKLKQKKYREQSGMFLSEGYRNVMDSIKKQQPSMLLVENTFAEPVPALEGTDIYRVSDAVLKEVCETKTPQGIVAVFHMPEERKITSGQVLLLNRVSDPGNLGTILRTALASGFTDIVMDENCADVFSPKVVRSAMSAIFSLNLIRVKDLADLVSALQEQGYTIYGAALTETAKSIYETSFSDKTAIMLGSEANGISKELLATLNEVYIIPMDSDIESLNVAVAGGISMYEVLRRKR